MHHDKIGKLSSRKIVKQFFYSATVVGRNFVFLQGRQGILKPGKHGARGIFVKSYMLKRVGDFSVAVRKNSVGVFTQKFDVKDIIFFIAQFVTCGYMKANDSFVFYGGYRRNRTSADMLSKMHQERKSGKRIFGRLIGDVNARTGRVY